MFNAQRYFGYCEIVLDTCQNRLTILKNNRIVRNDWENWTVITWQLSVTFNSGHRLRVSDNYNRNLENEVGRNFSYHFMSDTGECIFRFDTHDGAIGFDDPCHVHVGQNETELGNGDPRLKGFSLSRVDFLKAFNLIHKHLKGRALPWE